MKFEVHYDNRIYYAFFISSSLINPETLSVKITMYNTEYLLLKNNTTNSWANAESNKLKLSPELLNATGEVLEQILQQSA